jgi:hypothetical protein
MESLSVIDRRCGVDFNICCGKTSSNPARSALQVQSPDRLAVVGMPRDRLYTHHLGFLKRMAKLFAVRDLSKRLALLLPAPNSSSGIAERQHC